MQNVSDLNTATPDWSDENIISDHIHEYPSQQKKVSEGMYIPDEVVSGDPPQHSTQEQATNVLMSHTCTANLWFQNHNENKTERTMGNACRKGEGRLLLLHLSSIQ